MSKGERCRKVVKIVSNKCDQINERYLERENPCLQFSSLHSPWDSEQVTSPLWKVSLSLEVTRSLLRLKFRQTKLHTVCHLAAGVIFCNLLSSINIYSESTRGQPFT